MQRTRHKTATLIWTARIDDLVMVLNEAAFIIHQVGPKRILQMNISIMPDVIEMSLSAEQGTPGFDQGDDEELDALNQADDAGDEHGGHP